MPSLWFVCPAAGRAQLARICLRQLRRTCNQLAQHGIHATAVVVADDENLATATELGFATVRRDNRFVSRKFNDGIQLALDERHNPTPADYVVPIGSDDWIDYRILLDLPAGHTIRCFQKISFVREDGLEMTSRNLENLGGAGIRVYPRQVMGMCGYRPGDEDRLRACDTSILTNLSRTYERQTARPRRQLRVHHVDIDPRQIVDWKSPDTQLNSYSSLRRHRPIDTNDPFEQLAGFYPDEALDEMAAHYGVRRLAAA